MGLKTSQVRPLLGEIRHIQTQWILSQPATVKRGAVLQRMLLLKPKMVYLSRRERHRAVSRLVTELDNALNYVLKAPQVEQDSCMKYFVDFLEAVLTYLKAYGGS
jgi:CRISPR type III-A-associated protein Csm2